MSPPPVLLDIKDEGVFNGYEIQDTLIPFIDRVMSQRIANILQYAKGHRSGLDQSTIIEQCTLRFESEWSAS